MHAIEELAGFVAGHREGTLPKPARETAALLVTDLIAATAAGLNSTLAASARAAAAELYGSGAARVWLTGHSLSIAGAAMANAAAASALDIDDGHRGAAGHAGAGVVPAALAVGQAIGAPDERILDAIALGYDIALRVATSRPTAIIETYSSGRWVGYGAAAAAGRLLGLDAGQMAHALAIAGAEGPISFPTGSSLYQGSTVKEVIPPAVVAGLTGAFRARAGANGPLDLLDDDGRHVRAVLTGGLGETWWLQQCYLKPYACCRYMHAAIDAIVELRDFGKPVSKLRIETFPQGLRLSNARAPKTLEGGQYSFYFSCALAALHGAEALQPVDPARLADAEVLELAARIELAAHEDFAASFPVGTPCRVILDQGDGPQSLTVPHPLGDVANPMSRAQVTEKFRRIAAGSMGPDWQDNVLAALDGLLDQGFGPLFAALAAPRLILAAE
ncbi:MmgE/PrpD family protein [Mesorhizobium sp. CAU 1741]|uniref:MmgE/PrpD family protein n=1 Tax=Mesorhizobium sp. CAU 1741 TaxID=3140366 RepID=UPI00325C0844